MCINRDNICYLIITFFHFNYQLQFKRSLSHSQCPIGFDIDIIMLVSHDVENNYILRVDKTLSLSRHNGYIYKWTKFVNLSWEYTILL